MLWPCHQHTGFAVSSLEQGDGELGTPSQGVPDLPSDTAAFGLATFGYYEGSLVRCGFLGAHKAFRHPCTFKARLPACQG